MTEAPTVRLVDGLLQITWPDPRPAKFEITSDLFESLITELNAHRRNVAKATTVLTTVLAGIITDASNAAVG